MAISDMRADATAAVWRCDSAGTAGSSRAASATVRKSPLPSSPPHPPCVRQQVISREWGLSQERQPVKRQAKPDATAGCLCAH